MWEWNELGQRWKGKRCGFSLKGRDTGGMPKPLGEKDLCGGGGGDVP